MSNTSSVTQSQQFLTRSKRYVWSLSELSKAWLEFNQNHVVVYRETVQICHYFNFLLSLSLLYDVMLPRVTAHWAAQLDVYSGSRIFWSSRKKWIQIKECPRNRRLMGVLVLANIETSNKCLLCFSTRKKWCVCVCVSPAVEQITLEPFSLCNE